MLRFVCVWNVHRIGSARATKTRLTGGYGVAAAFPRRHWPRLWASGGENSRPRSATRVGSITLHPLRLCASRLRAARTCSRVSPWWSSHSPPRGHHSIQRGELLGYGGRADRPDPEPVPGPLLHALSQSVCQNRDALKPSYATVLILLQVNFLALKVISNGVYPGEPKRMETEYHDNRAAVR